MAMMLAVDLRGHERLKENELRSPVFGKPSVTRSRLTRITRPLSFRTSHRTSMSRRAITPYIVAGAAGAPINNHDSMTVHVCSPGLITGVYTFRPLFQEAAEK